MTVMFVSIIYRYMYFWLIKVTSDKRKSKRVAKKAIARRATPLVHSWITDYDKRFRKIRTVCNRNGYKQVRLVQRSVRNGYRYHARSIITLFLRDTGAGCVSWA